MTPEQPPVAGPPGADPLGDREGERLDYPRVRERIRDLRSETWYVPGVATILLVGVDLFFRGKLDALLPGHHLVTTDTIAEPELVIADISRVEPEEVADAWPDIPIVGFSSHTDTAGLRRANAAGFDTGYDFGDYTYKAWEYFDELLASVE